MRLWRCANVPASNIIQVAIEIDGMLEPRTSVTEGVGFNDERTR
jgi:hypothetical protein